MAISWHGLHPEDIYSQCAPCRKLLTRAASDIMGEIQILQDECSYKSSPIRNRLLTDAIDMAVEKAMEQSIRHGIEIGLKAQKRADTVNETLNLYRQQLQHAHDENDRLARAEQHSQEVIQDLREELDRVRKEVTCVDKPFGSIEPRKRHFFDYERNYWGESPSSFSEEEPEDEFFEEYDDSFDETRVIPFNGSSIYNIELSALQWGSSSRELDHTMIHPGMIKLWLHLAQYPGNDRFVRAISKLCSKAHRIPNSQRTDVEHYLLQNWRVPQYFKDQRNNIQWAINTRSADYDTLHLVVDASNHGIGIVLHDIGWQGWEFTDSHSIPVGPDNKIITSWAELVAVEVGFRMLIAENYGCTNVVVLSDNSGVVKALSNRYWQDRFGLNAILRRILGLCQEYGISIRAEWIPSGENPADPISRGVIPGVDVLNMIPGNPSLLPHKIADLLLPTYT